MQKTTLSSKWDARSFEVRVEQIKFEWDDRTVNVVETCYTPEGWYIGDIQVATDLANRGIKPELVNASDTVCSIGFSEKDQKFYGWSHRAMYGFAIGDVVKEGDCVASSGWTSEYLAEHPGADVSLPVGFTAKTINDCRNMAIAFADSVS